MWITNIYLLLSLFNVNALPLYKPYYSLSLNNSKLFFQQIFNNTFNEVYNNITKSIKNNNSFYVFDSPFCQEPENFYNKIKYNVYTSITNINYKKPICPKNYKNGYILWSSNIPIQYFISMNRIEKYIKILKKKLNTTFPNSNISSIYNIPSNNKYTIFSTNCCPFYNISF